MNKIKGKYKRVAFLLVILGVIISLCFSFLILNQEYSSNSIIDIEKIGSFGSFIGGIVGSMWALAGVILIFQALIDQQELIKLNFKEYTNQIESLNLSKAAFQDAKEYNNIQKFEVTFFNLIDRLGVVEDQIKLNLNKNSYTGKDSFERLFNYLLKKYNKKLKEYGITDSESITDQFEDIKYSLNKEDSALIKKLIPSFKIMNRILILINESRLSTNIKQGYIKTLIAHLSLEQIALVFHYSQFLYLDFLEESEKDLKDFFQLCSELELFQYLRPTDTFEFKLCDKRFSYEKSIVGNSFISYQYLSDIVEQTIRKTIKSRETQTVEPGSFSTLKVKIIENLVIVLFKMDYSHNIKFSKSDELLFENMVHFILWFNLQKVNYFNFITGSLKEFDFRNDLEESPNKYEDIIEKEINSFKTKSTEDFIEFIELNREKKFANNV